MWPSLLLLLLLPFYVSSHARRTESLAGFGEFFGPRSEPRRRGGRERSLRHPTPVTARSEERAKNKENNRDEEGAARRKRERGNENPERGMGGGEGRGAYSGWNYNLGPSRVTRPALGWVIRGDCRKHRLGFLAVSPSPPEPFPSLLLRPACYSFLSIFTASSIFRRCKPAVRLVQVLRVGLFLPGRESNRDRKKPRGPPLGGWAPQGLFSPSKQPVPKRHVDLLRPFLINNDQRGLLPPPLLRRHCQFVRHRPV